MKTFDTHMKVCHLINIDIMVKDRYGNIADFQPVVHYYRLVGFRLRYEEEDATFNVMSMKIGNFIHIDILIKLEPKHGTIAYLQ